jgi:hypothetical protein
MQDPGYGVPRIPPAVEKLPWYPLSPRIGHQTRRFWGFWSPICSSSQLNANFFNRLSYSATFINRLVHSSSGVSISRSSSRSWAAILRPASATPRAYTPVRISPRLAPRSPRASSPKKEVVDLPDSHTGELDHHKTVDLPDSFFPHPPLGSQQATAATRKEVEGGSL